MYCFWGYCCVPKLQDSLIWLMKLWKSCAGEAVFSWPLPCRADTCKQKWLICKRRWCISLDLLTDLKIWMTSWSCEPFYIWNTQTSVSCLKIPTRLALLVSHHWNNVVPLLGLWPQRLIFLPHAQMPQRMFLTNKWQLRVPDKLGHCHIFLKLLSLSVWQSSWSSLEDSYSET